MTKKTARKVAARARQAKVGGKYTEHLSPDKNFRVPIVEAADQLRMAIMTSAPPFGLNTEPETWFKGILFNRGNGPQPGEATEIILWCKEGMRVHPVVEAVLTDRNLHWMGYPVEVHNSGEPDAAWTMAPGKSNTGLEKRVDEAFLILNSGVHFKGKLAPTREALLTRIQQALRVLSPQRAVLEQAGDELLLEKLDDMFGPAPSENKVMVNREPYQLQLERQDVFDALFAMYSKGSVSINDILALFNLDPGEVKEKLDRDTFTVNNSTFNETVRTVYQKSAVPSRGSEQIILTFLRWLRTKGPDSLTHGDSQAFIAAENLVEEYLKKKSHPWQIDNMGWAIANDVERLLPVTEMERIEHFRDDQKWGARFTANGRPIEMTVTLDTIILSTGPNDKAAGYHDQVSAVQAIVRYLEGKEGRMCEAPFPPVSTADVFRSQYPDEPLPPGMLDSGIGATAAEVMAYWKDVPEAKKCVDSKKLRLGVTNDDPKKPLISWTSLARSKDCQGFSEWWNALPEATRYDRSGYRLTR